MTVHVSVRSTSALMLSVSLFRLPTRTCSDYREVGGTRVPPSHMESTEMGGRTISQVERVEGGIELAPDTVTLQPSTESDRKK